MLQEVKIMRDNGIPTIVWICPFLPFINDTEENLRGLLDYCIEAKVHGILNFGIGVTLREGDREYFYKKLDEHFPGMKERYHQKYGYRYEVKSDNSDLLMKIFKEECDNAGIVTGNDRIFEYMHTFEEKQESRQMSLF